MRSTHNGLEERLQVSEMFLHQGMCNALRAFCDFVLNAFYHACEKDAVEFADRAVWLPDTGSDGAEAFVARSGVTFLVFGVEKKIGKQEFHLIRSL